MLQRVKSASVTVDGQLISQIGKGLLVLAAISKDDTEKDVESMAGKILKAKLWDNEEEPPGRVSATLIASLSPADSPSGNGASLSLGEKFFVVCYPLTC